jgi:hypothetical protein
MSRLLFLANGLVSVLVDATANVFSCQKLRICYTIPCPTWHFGDRIQRVLPVI